MNNLFFFKITGPLLEIILIGTLFTIFYPIFIWCSFKKSPENDEFKAHLALPNAFYGIILLILLFSNSPVLIKIFAFICKIFYFIISHNIHKKRNPKSKTMFLIIFLQTILFVLIFQYFFRGPQYTLFLNKISEGIFISLIVFIIVSAVQKKFFLRR